MPPTEFEPTVSAGERPQNHALNHAATGTDTSKLYYVQLQERILLGI
jgi:hypothetical protein